MNPLSQGGVFRCGPRAPRATYDRSSQRGSALVELTWLGLLLIIPLVYLILTFLTVQRSSFGATEAVRAAGRAYVLAPDVQSAQQRALEAARVALADQGVELRPAQMQISCYPTSAACLTPGSTVSVSLDLDVRLPLMPSLGGDGIASVAVHASHVEAVGTFRETG